MAAVGTFGDALKRLRGDITQDELARRSGVPRGTIAGLESDKAKDPQWETAVLLARGLGVPLDTFAQVADDVRALTKPDALDRLATVEGWVEEAEPRLQAAAELGTELDLLTGDLTTLVASLRSAGFVLPRLAVLKSIHRTDRERAG